MRPRFDDEGGRGTRERARRRSWPGGRRDRVCDLGEASDSARLTMVQ